MWFMRSLLVFITGKISFWGYFLIFLFFPPVLTCSLHAVCWIRKQSALELLIHKQDRIKQGVIAPWLPPSGLCIPSHSRIFGQNSQILLSLFTHPILSALPWLLGHMAWCTIVISCSKSLPAPADVCLLPHWEPLRCHKTHTHSRQESSLLQ